MCYARCGCALLSAAFVNAAGPALACVSTLVPGVARLPVANQIHAKVRPTLCGAGHVGRHAAMPTYAVLIADCNGSGDLQGPVKGDSMGGADDDLGRHGQGEWPPLLAAVQKREYAPRDSCCAAQLEWTADEREMIIAENSPVLSRLVTDEVV